ncbi:MAG TPA: GNAT family N-acetyltransferase, partial [Flavobacterium sp.]|nr:GNAT family N-acetyltransferase [Flavobacterium sp.]
MAIELIDEFRLEKTVKKQIASLLKICFPEEEFHGRTYFKQLPHYRLLLKKDERLIGQLGLDYRVMLLGKKPITVLGVIDLAILPEFQGQGFGTELLRK